MMHEAARDPRLHTALTTLLFNVDIDTFDFAIDQIADVRCYWGIDPDAMPAVIDIYKRNVAEGYE